MQQPLPLMQLQPPSAACRTAQPMLHLSCSSRQQMLQLLLLPLPQQLPAACKTEQPTLHRQRQTGLQTCSRQQQAALPA